MSNPAIPPAQSHSRLIRFLSDLAVVNAETASRDFGERLGLLLNFSDSILLADALKAQNLPVILSDPPAAAHVATHVADAIRATFLRTRGQLVAAVVNSCASGAMQGRIKWPAVTSGADATPFEPFLRFYVAHQRDMDVGVRALRSTVREAMAGVSPALHQLVSLDIVLEDTLWDHSRRFLAVVPRFLEKRFDWLQQQHRASLTNPAETVAADWLAQFCKETQGLLLAELELRLQPVLGLVEALNNEVNKTT